MAHAAKTLENKTSNPNAEFVNRLEARIDNLGLRRHHTMSFDILPPEIIVLIADPVHATRDFFSFLRVSQKLYSLLIADLYRRNIQSDGGSALVWYASHGNANGVQNNVNLRSLSRDQSTGLLQAIIHRHIRVVQMFLENGASPDAADLRSRRGLMLSITGRSEIDITRLLFDHGARANAIVSDKCPPLLEAVRSNQASKVTLLLKHGADPCILGGRYGMNLLHVAAAKNAPKETIKILLQSGIFVDSEDSHGRTPLQVAAEHSDSLRWPMTRQSGSRARSECVDIPSPGFLQHVRIHFKHLHTRIDSFDVSAFTSVMPTALSIFYCSSNMDMDCILNLCGYPTV